MKLKKIKEESKIFLRGLTSYGIPHLTRCKSLYNKIFWLFFSFLSILISIWYIYDAIQSYLSYDIVTKVVSVYEQPLQFPTISFCCYGGDFFNSRQLKEIIRECMFNLDTGCKDDLDNYFEPFYNPVNGHCFRFNSGKNMFERFLF